MKPILLLILLTFLSLVSPGAVAIIDVADASKRLTFMGHAVADLRS